jgi:hypothetical protein|tara:strand:+ start:48 stop:203 length:156 start_codon:yes stop_codon:yes gene_type:complete
MKFTKILTALLLTFGILFASGCWVTKTGTYIKDKSKSAYSSTKSALGFDEE